ncbi:MAG: HIT family protein [Vicinamibacteria bacterium]
MSFEPTLFDKIIRGEIPSYKVYEDERVFAFLDIGPISKGHTLVVPKESQAYLHELSDDSAAAIGRALPRLCRAVMKATGASDYNVLQNNGSAAHQAVFHVHFHIIPRFRREGLGLVWNPSSLSRESARELVSSMRAALQEDAGA